MNSSPSVPDLAAIQAARARIAGIAHETPFIWSAWLSEAIRADVWLKLELVQLTGSFKVRGAANAVAKLKESNPDVSVVVTASAGNHGQGVALAAGRAGLAVRVYVPSTAPDAKRQALRRLGAQVVEVMSYDAAETAARGDAERTGATYIPPYHDADVIAGAGTVALEMLEAQPSLDAFVVPLGGGGLLSSVAIAARVLAPKSIIVGAEAAASPVFTAALREGHPVTVDVQPTLADGLAGNMDPGSRTFPLVRDLVDRVVTVPEPSIERAMRDLIVHERLVVEGAAAVGVGALLDGGLDLAGRQIGVILTGRNVDASTIERVLAHR